MQSSSSAWLPKQGEFGHWTEEFQWHEREANRRGGFIATSGSASC